VTISSTLEVGAAANSITAIITTAAAAATAVVTVCTPPISYCYPNFNRIAVLNALALYARSAMELAGQRRCRYGGRLRVVAEW